LELQNETELLKRKFDDKEHHFEKKLNEINENLQNQISENSELKLQTKKNDEVIINQKDLILELESELETLEKDMQSALEQSEADLISTTNQLKDAMEKLKHTEKIKKNYLLKLRLKIQQCFNMKPTLQN